MRGKRYWVVIGMAAVIALAFYLYRRSRARRHRESLRDEALDESFPASDPPATQDFSSPDGRDPPARDA